MGATEESVRAAFDAANSLNEWATGAVVLGVAIELFALLIFSKGMPRNEKLALLTGSILVVIGVAGEYVFGSRASNAAAELQRIADVKIASAQDQAATARADVALTIAKYGDLDRFVRDKTNDIGQTLKTTEGRANAALTAMKTLAADEMKLKNALRQDENRLAANEQAHQELVEAMAPRGIIIDGNKTMEALKPYADVPAYISPMADPAELDIPQLANGVSDLLRYGGMHPMLLQPSDLIFVDGIQIEYVSRETDDTAKLAAMALLKLLVKQHIDAHICAVGTDPDGTIAMPEWLTKVPKNGVLVRVGRKPNEFFLKKLFVEHGMFSKPDLKDLAPCFGQK